MELKHYFTFRKRKKNEPAIGMDNHGAREGLHFWISEDIPNPDFDKKKRTNDDNPKTIHTSLSVHLTREDAWALVKEIKDRLF